MLKDRKYTDSLALSPQFRDSEYHKTGTNETEILPRALQLCDYPIRQNYTFMGVGCVSRILMTAWIIFIKKRCSSREYRIM